MWALQLGAIRNVIRARIYCSARQCVRRVQLARNFNSEQLWIFLVQYKLHQRLTPESDTLKTCPLGNFLGQVLVEQKTINFGLVKCAPKSGAKAKCSKFPFLPIFSVRLTYLDRRRECVAGNLAHCDHQCTLFCAQWATELKRTLPYRSL